MCDHIVSPQPQGRWSSRFGVRQYAWLPFRPDTPPEWYGPLGYIVAFLGVAGVTGLLWATQSLLNLGSVYLIYLVVVVAVAAGWGWKQGFLSSILAFLAANYFFIDPRFTLTVTDGQDVLALTIFLGISTVTSQLVARLRWEAHEARRSQQITFTLYELSKTVNRQHNLKQLLDEVCSQLCVVLQLEAAKVTLGAPDSSVDLTSYIGASLDEPAYTLNVVRAPIYTSQQSVGVLLLQLQSERHLTATEAQLVEAFGEQLQIAIERDRLQQAEVDTEVLRRTDALRLALLSTVAHDLRTPLASIKAASTSLLKPPTRWSIEDQASFLQAIVSEADRINRIVTNLLDMSRIEEGKLYPHKEPHQIADVIATVLERLAPTLMGRPLEMAIEAGIPTVFMDAVEIDEVLTNLIENADKYTPTGTPIRVRAARRGDSIEMEVSDEGPGISEESLPHIFDRFYRVQDGATSGVQGSGLGLAIAKGIIEAHGGRIGGSNRPHGGLSIIFTLPIV